MTNCRSCGAPLTLSFLDLGSTPLANSYVACDADLSTELRVPLRVVVCEQCYLVQLGEIVPPEALFNDYAYFSSFSSTWIEHGRQFATEITQSLSLDRNSLVIEIASNDGYLLKHFSQAGIPVYGIEPAANVASIAIEKGIPTDINYFSLKYAQQLSAQGYRADLLIANNVLAHVPDINDFVAGLAVLIKSNGWVSIECPHIVPMIENVEFDTIYHEHVFYFSLLSLDPIFKRHGLSIVDVYELRTHGGSLRLLVTHAGRRLPETARKQSILSKEIKLGLSDSSGYKCFSDKVQSCRNSVLDFVAGARKAGKTIAAYGAAAKGNTLLNFCGLTHYDITMVADRNHRKQNHLLPGSHIPVVSPERMLASKPDYLFILPWNLKSEIVEQMADIRSWGGIFVTPVPEITLHA